MHRSGTVCTPILDISDAYAPLKVDILVKFMGVSMVVRPPGVRNKLVEGIISLFASYFSNITGVGSIAAALLDAHVRYNTGMD